MGFLGIKFIMKIRNFQYGKGLNKLDEIICNWDTSLVFDNKNWRKILLIWE